MALLITDPAGGILPALTFTAQRGIDSAHTAIKITNPGVVAVEAGIVVFEVERTSGLADYATSGNPAVDERWGRFQITGVDSTVTPGQESGISFAQPMGYLSNAYLPSILPGNAILADVWISQPSTSAGGGSVRAQIQIANEVIAVPVGPGVTAVGHGIISEVNEPVSILLSGREVTATGTPDDEVHISAGSYLIDGTEYTDGADVEALDQDDSAAAALASGEEYYAVLVQDAGAIVVTKGLKDTIGDAVPPTPTPGIFLALVRVEYDAAASVITAGDITLNEPTYGRYLVVEAATGLTATVHTGRALIANYMQRRAVPGDVTLVNSATNRVWLEYNGAVTVTQTAALPSAGALLLAELVTAGGNVTGNTDTRTYVGQAGELSLHAATHATGGTDPVTPAAIGAAGLASPAFTGTPTAPTAGPADNSTTIATTAYVDDAVSGATSGTIGTAIERVVHWTGDGTAQPPALSPVPAVGTIPQVFVGGMNRREGGGLDYTRSGTDDEQIDFTTVLNVGELLKVQYWG